MGRNFLVLPSIADAESTRLMRAVEFKKPSMKKLLDKLLDKFQFTTYNL